MATMFPCPNCGGQLRYSIEGHALRCQSCGELTEMADYKPDDKIGFDTVTTNIYQCPTCAGEIQLFDNDGMEFCPFCGNQAVMSEKFSTEGAPKYVLPFKLTKQQAKDKYDLFTKKLHFAPEGLNSNESIDKMVPLYVPYYLYDYSARDTITFKGVSNQTSGDYTIINKANVNVKVDVDHLKVPFDASQSLDDTMAEVLEPFPMEEIEDFNPGFLAGFFVENSTVEKDLYQDDAMDKAVDYLTGKVIAKAGEYHPELGAKTEVEGAIINDLNYNCTDGAYLPMYFLTSREGDRVAYSIVNGATGKTYIDMPIEKHKLFRRAISTSAIIFVVLLLASFVMGFSFKVKSLCSIGAFISSLVALTGAILANKTYRRDNHLDDKGYFMTKDEAKKSKATVKKKPGSLPTFVWSALIVFFGIIVFLVFMGNVNVFGILPYLLYPTSFVMVIVALCKVGKGKKKVMLLGILGWFAALVVRLANLPNDIWYFGALIIAFMIILKAITSIVEEYNRFATHPSPQFLKKGGRLENA
ncbi:hypothetical protein SAMN02910298_01841 [Pseudobutyrivibrio sp. YE44]|uniref:hypothetical protein n=1 Tax=Pseudobutyrivibrio sp. YE44 TaxID=1520802 RepID=UPI0008922D81|nr:hypothetical protein [Pseudobutyrivibrio sp. YE44]SDB37874.1 hypothetical protein SAMN02910298_01841 [Pseudobutyrivibrio sp. YE44]